MLRGIDAVFAALEFVYYSRVPAHLSHFLLARSPGLIDQRGTHIFKEKIFGPAELGSMAVLRA